MTSSTARTGTAILSGDRGAFNSRHTGVVDTVIVVVPLSLDVGIVRLSIAMGKPSFLHLMRLRSYRRSTGMWLQVLA
jgi:hypothetical protein